MSYTNIRVTICDSCGKEVTENQSSEINKQQKRSLFPSTQEDGPTRYWYHFYNTQGSYEFCCWECVGIFSEKQIAEGKNRLEDDVAT